MHNTKGQILKFKTNINCGSCISKVAPRLDESVGTGNWDVDTASPDKILSVQSPGVSEDEIVKTIQQTGFRAEPVLV
jgi:copper chaperone